MRYVEDIGKADNNNIDRNFKADKPNQKWTTDVTQFNYGIILWKT